MSLRRSACCRAVLDVNTQGSPIIRRATSFDADAQIRRALPEIYPRLWRYALSLTRHRAEAEDLAHETILKALTKSDQFTPGTRADRWMFRILHRLWLNRLRAGKVRRGTGVIAVEDAGLTADQDAEQTFFGTQVLSAILALSDAQRSAVMMVYVEGFSYAEAAEMLDVPIGTIMSRLAAARAKLKDQLGDRE